MTALSLFVERLEESEQRRRDRSRETNRAIGAPVLRPVEGSIKGESGRRYRSPDERDGLLLQAAAFLVTG